MSILDPHTVIRGEAAASAGLVLLRGEGLERVVEVGALLRPHIGAVARRWATAHAATWEGTDPREDERRFAEELGGLLDHLDQGNLIAWLCAEGRRHQQAGVPFAEVVASVHLFEQACVDELRAAGLSGDQVLDAYLSLDRLSHVRVMLLANAYYDAEVEAAREVGAALTRELATTRGRSSFHALRGASRPMQELYEHVALCARGRETVLICGETGTGKELIARAIHAESGDPPERFIAVNCAAMARELVESELFGHRKGAFSGAHTDRPGLARSAAGGTLFLDEVTEIPPDVQAKLLRLIQEHAVRPVGDTREIPVDVRVVASTNRALEAEVRAGRFRRDLYYRLARLVLRVPPLRDRADDVPMLVAHFLERASLRKTLSTAALDRLSLHSWPGNVRELENVVHAACAFARGDLIRVEDLPPLAEDEALPDVERPQTLRGAERETIARVMEEARGNVSMAARVLGISRKQLYVKLRLYGIEPRP
ncbi:MAG: hypothetical protein AMXMBFR64_58690 [Myxococcales bacterium]